MENKYFTPDIEDICVGYEYEQLINQVWTKEVFAKGSYLPENIDLLNWIHSCVLSKKIRVPYLTKEQIEDEGWKFKKQLCSDEFCKGWQIEFIKNEMKYNFSFNQNYSANFYTWNSIEGTHTIFKGKCKDINTFRKICKLLEI